MELGCFGTYSFKESSSSWCFIMSELEKIFCRVLPPRNLISRFRLGENVLDVLDVLDVVFDSFLLLYGVKIVKLRSLTGIH